MGPEVKIIRHPEGHLKEIKVIKEHTVNTESFQPQTLEWFIHNDLREINGEFDKKGVELEQAKNQTDKEFIAKLNKNWKIDSIEAVLMNSNHPIFQEHTEEGIMKTKELLLEGFKKRIAKLDVSVTPSTTEWGADPFDIQKQMDSADLSGATKKMYLRNYEAYLDKLVEMRFKELL